MKEILIGIWFILCLLGLFISYENAECKKQGYKYSYDYGCIKGEK